MKTGSKKIVANYNDNHDEKGRFTSGGAGADVPDRTPAAKFSRDNDGSGDKMKSGGPGADGTSAPGQKFPMPYRSSKSRGKPLGGEDVKDEVVSKLKEEESDKKLADRWQSSAAKVGGEAPALAGPKAAGLSKWAKFKASMGKWGEKGAELATELGKESAIYMIVEQAMHLAGNSAGHARLQGKQRSGSKRIVCNYNENRDENGRFTFSSGGDSGDNEAPGSWSDRYNKEMDAKDADKKAPAKPSKLKKLGSKIVDKAAGAADSAIHFFGIGNAATPVSRTGSRRVICNVGSVAGGGPDMDTKDDPVAKANDARTAAERNAEEAANAAERVQSIQDAKKLREEAIAHSQKAHAGSGRGKNAGKAHAIAAMAHKDAHAAFTKISAKSSGHDIESRANAMTMAEEHKAAAERHEAIASGKPDPANAFNFGKKNK